MIPSQDLLPHMRHVLAAERDLRDLGLVWQMIESSAAISCPVEAGPVLPTLVATRQRFEQLQTRLIDKLVQENQDDLGDELGAVAQCAIDILVRNLYERTADVGFLATDDSLRQFCAATPDERLRQEGAIHQRLAAYQAKYTVYEDILLLSPQGEVLTRLDPRHGGSHSHSPLIKQALQHQGYLEYFGPSDLAPDVSHALLYAHAIHAPHGPALGVLVLRFRFADEMQRIFASTADTRHTLAVVLIDADQRVIASNDADHIAPGVHLRPTAAGVVSLSSFGGREYLAVCCPSQGYQGYAGPNWRAVAMVSLLTAFRHQDTNTADDEALAPLDNPELLQISADAGAINRDLRRTVWNGRLMAHAQQGEALRLKAVLGQVHQAGSRTRNRVNLAIRDLYRMALARARGQARSLAHLAADIMDRNLYERVNDCRWWAVSPAIQQALAAAPHHGQANPALNAVLDHINGLYTVYSRLLAFDQDGLIRGSSHTSRDATLIGSSVPGTWLQAVRELQDEQQYAVTPFENNPLYGGGATYVYLAAVRAPGEAGGFLGGVALIFNAPIEFDTMLREVLGERAGFAAFVGAQGQVLASTDPALQSSPALAFIGDDAMVEHQGAHYACARVRASGYREYKTSDGYDNQVSVVVGLRLGAAERRRHSLSELELLPHRAPSPHLSIEAAVFSVGPHRYALPSEAVLMAVPPERMVRSPGGLGLLEIDTGTHKLALAVTCGRQRFGIGYPARSSDGVVLVLRSSRDPQRPAFGLQVDDVLGVLTINPDDVHPTPSGAQTDGMVSSLINCRIHPPGEAAQAALIQMLDPALLLGTGR